MKKANLKVSEARKVVDMDIAVIDKDTAMLTAWSTEILKEKAALDVAKAGKEVDMDSAVIRKYTAFLIGGTAGILYQKATVESRQRD